nr:hypothetical protein [Stenotrophomonas maltophilia]
MERSASGWINGFIGVVIFAGSLPATRLRVWTDAGCGSARRERISSSLALGPWGCLSGAAARGAR